MIDSETEATCQWSIKHVKVAVREVFTTAARQSGMSLGQWFNTHGRTLAEHYLASLTREAPGAVAAVDAAPGTAVVSLAAAGAPDRDAQRVTNLERLARLAVELGQVEANGTALRAAQRQVAKALRELG